MNNHVKPFIASYIFISISSNTNASLPVGSSLLEKKISYVNFISEKFFWLL